jgi:hypothetical protein
MFQIAWSALVTATVTDQALTNSDWHTSLWLGWSHVKAAFWVTALRTITQTQVAWPVASMHWGTRARPRGGSLKVVATTLRRSWAHLLKEITRVLELKDTIVNNYIWTWWPIRNYNPLRTAVGMSHHPHCIHHYVVSYYVRAILSSQAISRKRASCCFLFQFTYLLVSFRSSSICYVLFLVFLPLLPSVHLITI